MRFRRRERGRSSAQELVSAEGGTGGFWRELLGKRGGREPRATPTDDATASSSTISSRLTSKSPSKDVAPALSCDTDQLTEHDSLHVNQSLWDRAYEALGKENEDLVKRYEDLLEKAEEEARSMSSTTNRALPIRLTTPHNAVSDAAVQFDHARLVAMCENALARLDEKRATISIGSLEINPRAQIANAARLVLWTEDWIGAAVRASPEASIAWAGVCLALPLLTNPATADEANRDGFVYVTARMRYYTALEPLVERLYQRSDEKDAALRAKESIIPLYQSILDFQIRSALRFCHTPLRRYGGDMINPQDWKKRTEDIRLLEATVNENLHQINELEAGRELESLNKTSAASYETLQGFLSISKEQLKVAETHRDISQVSLSLQQDAVKRHLSEKEEKCHQTFRLTTSKKDATYEWYKDRVEAQVEGTCQWLVTHESFQEWLSQESGVLLISADPGCGKSVLAKYLIDQVLQSGTVCYFFFKDQDQNTVRQALCAVLHQLFSQKPSLIKHAMSEFSKNGAGLVNTTASLWKIFDSVVEDPEAGAIIVVLDALDECAELEFQDLMRHIRARFLAKRSGGDKLKFLLTSRPYNQIVSEFRYLFDAIPRIHIPGEEHSEAISHEVSLVVASRAKSLGLSSDLTEYVTRKLLEVPNRTYLWVHLIFNYMETGELKKTLKGVDAIITRLPRNVNEAYNQILERSPNPDEARKALAIVLAAQRPLTLSEMNVAVNIQHGHQSFHDLDLENDSDFRSTLRSWCGLFVSINHGKVYFLHQTAREFLLADSSSSITAVQPVLRWCQSISTRHAHGVLVEKCVLYLSLFNTDSSHDVSNHSFLEYSANHWSLHFREAEVADDAPIITSVLQICDPDSNSYSAWFETLDGLGKYRRYSRFSSLHVPVFLGHKATLRRLLLSDTVDIDPEDSSGRTPLSWAASRGDEGIFRLLLATERVDINSKDNSGESPLWKAAARGHEGIVKLLLATGKVDINSKDNSGESPLWKAAARGHEGIVKLLLATGKVDIDSKDNSGGSPLLWAAARGHEGIVKLLLATGKVDINSKDNSGRSPLWEAAAGGHEGIVKLLLATGKVDIDSKDNSGSTPLSAAISSKYHTIVRLLEAEQVN